MMLVYQLYTNVTEPRPRKRIVTNPQRHASKVLYTNFDRIDHEICEPHMLCTTMDPFPVTPSDAWPTRERPFLLRQNDR